MAQLKPVLDSSGRITLYPGEGLSLPVVERDVTSGDLVDLSASALFFQLKSGFRKALLPHPENPLGRLILLTKLECETNVPAAGTQYVLLDEDGTTPVTLSFGTISWEGGGPWTS